MSRIKPGDEVFTAMIFLIFECFFFLLLSGYLQSVLPSEFGVPKKWHWPISQFFDKSKEKEKEAGRTVAPDLNEINLEDNDVRAERARVLAGEYEEDSPLVMTGTSCWF